MRERLRVFAFQNSTYPGREQNWDVFIGKEFALQAEYGEILTPEQIIAVGLLSMTRDTWSHGDVIEAEVERDEEGVIVRFSNITRATAEE